MAGSGTTADITDDTVERLRRRIGIPMKFRENAFYTVCNEDNFRHLAHAYGEDNPLYSDPKYGKTTVWGEMIAPPIFHGNAAGGFPYEQSEEQKAAMSGGDPLAGISAYFSGVEWEWWAPCVDGDRIQAMNALTAVDDKRSEFSGRTVLTWNGTIWMKADGTPVGARNFVFVHAGRSASKEKGKYKDLKPAHYTDEDLAEMDAINAAEVRRGAEDRTWGSVEIGDELVKIVRGPLLVVDIIAWHMGTGVGQTKAIVASRMAYKNRMRVPKFYTKNEYGSWDSVQRCHWDHAWAQEVGQPLAYDYGPMRDCWMMSSVANWIGDNAWMWKYRSSIRKFNYQGDATFITGKVVGKERVGDLPTVQLELQGVSQRGDTTITAHADVILPERAGERVRLPQPPGGAADDPYAVLQRFVRR